MRILFLLICLSLSAAKVTPPDPQPTPIQARAVVVIGQWALLVPVTGGGAAMLLDELGPALLAMRQPPGGVLIYTPVGDGLGRAASDLEGLLPSIAGFTRGEPSLPSELGYRYIAARYTLDVEPDGE